jgi:aminomethyltransferase
MTVSTPGKIDDASSSGGKPDPVTVRPAQALEVPNVAPNAASNAAPDETQLAGQLSALLDHVALAPLDDLGWISATGADRVRWLNGMTTNAIVQLQPGEGNYNFLLSAQGRIQGDAYIFALPDSLLLETDRSRLAMMMQLLDRFIIMDDVELNDVTATRSGLLCAGPQAAEILRSAGIETEGLAELSLREVPWRGFNLSLIHAHSPLVSRFELWAEPATIQELTSGLGTATPVGPEALELLRLLEGTPRYGIDIRDRELPQETGQTRALHFAKGCYLGQEIVERIRSRGNVHRTFHGFALQGELPAPGTAIEVDGKAVGELTSVARIPLSSGTLQLALGYIRREALDRAAQDGSQPLSYPGGQAVPAAVPVRNTRAIP